MTRLLVVVLLSLLVASVHAGPYEDCVLSNIKGVQVQGAVLAIYQACKEKTTPKACRDNEIAKRIEAQHPTSPIPQGKSLISDISDYQYKRLREHLLQDEIEAERDSCLRKCATATYWSRTFGECRSD